MPPVTHTLKTSTLYFADVAAGLKTVEVRRDDRDFRPGDLLRLVEYDNGAGPGRGYTGREALFRITHTLRGFEGLAPGWVALSLWPAFPNYCGACGQAYRVDDPKASPAERVAAHRAACPWLHRDPRDQLRRQLLIRLYDRHPMTDSRALVDDVLAVLDEARA